MRKIVGFLVLLSAIGIGTFVRPINSFAQTAATIGPTDAIGFDYLDSDYSLYVVTGFQTQYDGGTWSDIPSIVSATFNGVTTYKFVPPQTNGTHTVLIHACNAAGCGPASSPFAFVVLSAPSTAPTNVRRVPR